MIAIGIDTGGTCTDAAVLDTESREVLSFSKTLTTKKDLKVGILNALNGLNGELVQKAGYISLSTTLATNACVENKGGRAKLIFIGVSPNVVRRMKGTYGLPDVSDIYFMKGDPVREDSSENKPDWEQFYADVKEQFGVYDSVAVVQINPNYNDGEYEKTAESMIKDLLDIPCVKGYELYQEINVQKRGATALLNARLLPVMNDFFASIEFSLKELGLDQIPIVIVKSDGSVMSKEFAMKRPVETLLCGPAASIIGAIELSKERDALIVDMGGTTSDVALVSSGIPVTADAGISIGSWKTMVKGISIDTFALGGDSAVKYQNGKLFLDNRRQIPLCMLADQHPEIVPILDAVVRRRTAYSYPAHEFFTLMNDPADLGRFGAGEQRLIKALRKKPLSFEEAAAAAGASPFVFKVRRLEDEGIIMRAGVTPTDVMHLAGDYTEYNAEASGLGIAYLAGVTGLTGEEVQDEIYDMAKSRLYDNLVRILLKHEMKNEISEDEKALLEKLTSYIFKTRKKEFEDFYAKPHFTTASKLVAIGAPTKIFMDDVAKLLGTEAVCPNYAKVANAIGAAIGNISAEYTVKIEPDVMRRPYKTYLVTGSSPKAWFVTYKEALAAAKKLAHDRVIEKARQQGAVGQLTVDVQVYEDYYDLGGVRSNLFVETVVTARAKSFL